MPPAGRPVDATDAAVRQDEVIEAKAWERGEHLTCQNIPGENTAFHRRHRS